MLENHGHFTVLLSCHLLCLPMLFIFECCAPTVMVNAEPHALMHMQIYRHKSYQRSHIIVARTKWADFVGQTHGPDRSREEPSCMCVSLYLPTGIALLC